MKTRSISTAIAAFIMTIFMVQNGIAQNVSVSGAVVGNGLYPDLGSAFTAINSGAQNGASIMVAILGNTTETVTATLNQGAWTTLVISPAGSAARTISGNIAGPLIDFNGADHVFVDGLNTGGNSLTIDNSNNTASSTIRFINDAHVDVVQNTTILGANNSTTSGTVLFSTGTVTGNDTISINGCNIDASGTNFPTNGICSVGSAVAGMENNMVIINGNNISNYYNGTLVSAGILAGAGNTGWTIQNNRLFQTANRIFTVSNTHFGISITSGAGYQVLGNIIGYANATGTGTTNLIGNSVALTGTFPSSYNTTGTANATRYIAINAAFTAGGMASEIQNNTIAGFALYTSSGATTTNGIFCGIAVTSGNVNIGTITGNTIGATSGNGSIYTACTTSGGMVAGIYVSSTNNVSIRNNSIGAIDAMGTTATLCGGINGINIAGAMASYDVTNNTIGNTTVPNLRMGNLMTGAALSNAGTTFSSATGLATFNGILSSQAGIGTINANTIRNAFHYSSSASTSSSIRGITASGIVTISNNTITNLSSNSLNVNVASTLLSAMGIFMNSITTAGAVVRDNTISNIALINPAASGTNATGIAVYCGSADFYRNRISNIMNASSSVATATPGTASGFFLRQPGGVININNNMISLGVGQTTNTAFNGIWQQNSAVAYTLNAHFNSINIEGTAAAGAQPSFCLNRGSYSATQVTVAVNAMNNIFNNTRSGGTGKHYAIGNNYLAAATATGWGAGATNNNVLNAAAANVGYWGADQTFSGWQTASACDAASYSGVSVVFVNTATGDLHLNFGLTPTVIESGGVAAGGIVTDYDLDARPGPAGSVNGGGLFPDIGADEFDGVILDVLAPQINYTPLLFTCSTSDRTFTATITDLTGVPTSGALQPRVYFQKNAAGWNSAQGVLTSGTAQNGTWTFTISAAVMGGLVQGDIVSYYVIAQDVVMPTPNLRSNPSAGLVASDVNTVTTPPTTPNSYAINGILSGTYTVGVSGNYPTLTAAVAAYNTSCLSGAVIFSLIDATYPSETFPITILSNPTSSSTNTLTIQPASGNTATITGSDATGIIIMSGADYVTLNGSNSSTVNSVCPPVSASRDLTISNTNVAATAGVVWLGTAAGPNPVTNCTVQNCVIVGNAPTTTLVGLGSGGAGIGTSGTNNDNISFVNNDIRACQFGIYSGGLSAAVKNQNLVVNQNIMTGTVNNAIGITGITLNLTNNITVSGNSIANISNGGTQDVCAINVGFGAVGGFAATATGIADGASNVTITRNTIGSIQQTGTYSAAGIGLGNTISGTNLIENNMVSGVVSNGTAGDISAGIILGGGTATTNVYHNSVVMQGLITGATAASQTAACFAVTSATPSPLDIRNNIFINKQVGNTGATLRFTTIALGYSSTVGNYASLVSNYNDLYTAGSGPGTYQVGITGGMVAGTSRVSLSNWQTETGRDANTSNVPGSFVSPTDLHANAGSNPGIEDAGTYIVASNSDFDCASRDVCTPDIGADEFGTPREINVLGNTVNIVDGDVTPASTDSTDFGLQSVCNGTTSVTFTIQNPGTTALSISGVTISGPNASDFTVTTNPAATVAAGGSTVMVITFNPSATGALSATVTVNSDDCDEAVFDFAIQGTGTQIAASASGQTDPTCNAALTGTATVSVTGGVGPFTYNWLPSGGTSATATGIGAGTYTCTVTDVNGCAAMQTFTLTEPTAIVSANSQTDILCNGGNTGDATVSVTGGTPGYTYNWSPSGGTGSMAIGLTAGTYTCDITDASGCILQQIFIITEPPVLAATVQGWINPSTCGGNQGAIDITVTGGTPAYTFSWSTGATTEDISSLTAGTYSATVTDANGCTTTVVSTTLNDPNPPVVTLILANPDTACQTTTMPFTLSGESPAGGTYSGTGVSAGQFDPMTANLGWNLITYSYTDPVTLCSASAVDSIWVDICNGIVISSDVEWNVFPNPTNGTFSVSSLKAESGMLHVEIFAADGRVVSVEDRNVDNGKAFESFDISEQPVGVYYVKITNNNSSYIARIVRH